MVFIYKKEKALPPKLCNSFIQAFEQSDEQKPGILYNTELGDLSGEGKRSTDVTLSPLHENHSVWGSLLKEFLPILDNNVSNYISRHLTAFECLPPFTLYKYFNIQRYKPTEGFTQYHCERSSKKHGDRILVWMVYLNDVTDQGETEFYYQRHFEEPKQGNLIIWPSDWTHLHRGITSPTQTKYILTGWYVHTL